MIKTKLPVKEKIYDELTKTIIEKESTIDVSIDTSLFAEERWEANFPNNAKNETLFTYIERIKNAGAMDDKSQIVSNLKALFCFMEGEEISDFKSFCQMFDLSDSDYISRLIDKIKFVFDLVLNGSAVSSKN